MNQVQPTSSVHRTARAGIGSVSIAATALLLITGCEGPMTSSRMPTESPPTRPAVNPAVGVDADADVYTDGYAKSEPARAPVSTPSPRRVEDAAASQSQALGKTAPSFTLADKEDRPVSLTDYRGKWLVLYFYPKDDTPGCTCQATEFTDLLGRFHNLNAQVVGISPDSPGDHRFFAEKYDLKITLLSDVAQKVMRLYGAWVDTQVADQALGRVIRSTFAIDPNGRIAYHWPEVIPQGHADRVRERLELLQRG
jgi:peroxiredoxin Q/BCP